MCVIGRGKPAKKEHIVMEKKKRGTDESQLLFEELLI
jgi:hypothetical protein